MAIVVKGSGTSVGRPFTTNYWEVELEDGRQLRQFYNYDNNNNNKVNNNKRKTKETKQKKRAGWRCDDDKD